MALSYEKVTGVSRVGYAGNCTTGDETTAISQRQQQMVRLQAAQQQQQMGRLQAAQFLIILRVFRGRSGNDVISIANHT